MGIYSFYWCVLEMHSVQYRRAVSRMHAVISFGSQLVHETKNLIRRFSGIPNDQYTLTVLVCH